MHGETSTSVILEHIKNGNDKAVVDLLYKKVFPLVKKYILSRKGNVEDAYDLFQEALLQFYQLIGDNKYDEKYKVEAFIYNSCLYKWLNKSKKDSKIDFQESYEQHEYFQLEYSDFQFLGTKDEKLLENFLNSIGEKCKEILTYTVFNDMLLEDVVIRMGLPSIPAAKMQYQRCKQKILEEIKKNPNIVNRLKENAKH